MGPNGLGSMVNHNSIFIYICAETKKNIFIYVCKHEKKYKRQVERSWNMLSACLGLMMTQEPRNDASYMNIPNSMSWVITVIRRQRKMMRLMMRMMRSLRTRLLRGWSKFGWGRRPEKWPSLVNQPRKAQPRCHRLHHQRHQNKQYWCKHYSHRYVIFFWQPSMRIELPLHLWKSMFVVLQHIIKSP